MTKLLRDWWPIAAFLVPIVVVQNLWLGRYRAAGHAAEHLSSATALFGITFAIAVLVWAARPELRRRPELWLLSSAVLIAALMTAVANLRIVDVIGDRNWSVEQAETLGPALSGFTAGHRLADWSSKTVVVFAVLLALWLWRTHMVGPLVGIGAVVVSAVFPPWIFPGAGMVVLALALVVDRVRRLRVTE